MTSFARKMFQIGFMLLICGMFLLSGYISPEYKNEFCIVSFAIVGVFILTAMLSKKSDKSEENKKFALAGLNISLGITLILGKFIGITEYQALLVILIGVFIALSSVIFKKLPLNIKVKI